MENYNYLTNFPKVISGIDTLYYFYESNKVYSSFYSELLDQIESRKKELEILEIEYEDKNIKVILFNEAFEFNGKVKGFYWFTHISDTFKISFKDPTTNTDLKDIQVQLKANGIYWINMKPLINHIDHIFKSVITGYKPITRIDLNIFAQDDLSWLTKEMFVSRKRSYATHSKEISSKYRLGVCRTPFTKK